MRCAPPTRRGRGLRAPSPRVRSHRALALGVAGTILLGACSASGGNAATPPPTGMRIPSPFEVGQQVGLGDVRLRVASFARSGTTVAATVSLTNVAAHPVAVDPSRDFTIFFGTRRHAAGRVDGAAAPIAPGGQASYVLRFRVPTRYRYPLVWFETSTVPPTTVVLRGAGARA